MSDAPGSLSALITRGPRTSEPLLQICDYKQGQVPAKTSNAVLIAEIKAVNRRVHLLCRLDTPFYFAPHLAREP